MRKSDTLRALSVAGGTLSALAALALTAPTAHADPEILPPPAPAQGPPPPQAPEQSISTLAAAGDPAAPAPPAEVPHLMSPENLPPGTSDVPVEPPQSRGTSYLRDLLHAYQTQEIDGKGVLLLLTQRPLDANAMPTNGLPPGPQAPPGTPAGDPVAPLADAAPPGPVLPGTPPAPAIPGPPATP